MWRVVVVCNAVQCSAVVANSRDSSREEGADSSPFIIGQSPAARSSLPSPSPTASTRHSTLGPKADKCHNRGCWLAAGCGWRKQSPVGVGVHVVAVVLYIAFCIALRCAHRCPINYLCQHHQVEDRMGPTRYKMIVGSICPSHCVSLLELIFIINLSMCTWLPWTIVSRQKIIQVPLLEYFVLRVVLCQFKIRTSVKRGSSWEHAFAAAIWIPLLLANLLLTYSYKHHQHLIL